MEHFSFSTKPPIGESLRCHIRGERWDDAKQGYVSTGAGLADRLWALYGSYKEATQLVGSPDFLAYLETASDDLESTGSFRYRDRPPFLVGTWRGLAVYSDPTLPCGYAYLSESFRDGQRAQCWITDFD